MDQQQQNPQKKISVYLDSENLNTRGVQAYENVQETLRTAFPDYLITVKAYMNETLEDIQEDCKKARIEVCTWKDFSPDYADRRIICDMFTDTSQDSSERVVFVGTGDADFAPAIGALKKMGNKVVALVRKKNSSGASQHVITAATCNSDWDELTEGNGFELIGGMPLRDHLAAIIPDPPNLPFNTELSFSLIYWDLTTQPIPLSKKRGRLGRPDYGEEYINFFLDELFGKCIKKDRPGNLKLTEFYAGKQVKATGRSELVSVVVNKRQKEVSRSNVMMSHILREAHYLKEDSDIYIISSEETLDVAIACLVKRKHRVHVVFPEKGHKLNERKGALKKVATTLLEWTPPKPKVTPKYDVKQL